MTSQIKIFLLLCLFVWCMLTTKSTKFLQLQAFWTLFFILGTVVVDSVAHSALKMNCLAHIYFRSCAPPPILPNGVTEDI